MHHQEKNDEDHCFLSWWTKAVHIKSTNIWDIDQMKPLSATVVLSFFIHSELSPFYGYGFNTYFRTFYHAISFHASYWLVLCLFIVAPPKFKTIAQIFYRPLMMP